MNILLEMNALTSTPRDTRPRDANGQRTANGGKCGERKSGRLKEKEVGNVVEGQRNMPEILSPPAVEPFGICGKMPRSSNLVAARTHCVPGAARRRRRTAFDRVRRKPKSL
ncbi:hypothetical protein [Paraburkholderia dilworthii]|uniref:hypothetical protein n=1 Tax=Paraburkholderia dilworthii TaxID=948106 RepID=UPI001427E123|nr:hypothetical protein [Paraburkholderia dilworthii]